MRKKYNSCYGNNHYILKGEKEINEDERMVVKALDMASMMLSMKGMEKDLKFSDTELKALYKLYKSCHRTISLLEAEAMIDKIEKERES